MCVIHSDNYFYFAKKVFVISEKIGNEIKLALNFSVFRGFLRNNIQKNSCCLFLRKKAKLFEHIKLEISVIRFLKG